MDSNVGGQGERWKYSDRLDSLVLVAKMAVAYFKSKTNNNSFDLSNLYRVERVHYYDNCYHMNYIPKQYLTI
jgi:hypothetical protein